MWWIDAVDAIRTNATRKYRVSMASNDNSPRPSKKALICASVFGLVAIVLPWISFDVALNVLLLGTVMVLPWAAWDSVRLARHPVAHYTLLVSRC